MTRIYLAAAAAALIAGLFGWVFWQGKIAERRALELDAQRVRIEALEGAKKRRNDIENLDDDELLRSLLRRVRPGLAE